MAAATTTPSDAFNNHYPDLIDQCYSHRHQACAYHILDLALPGLCLAVEQALSETAQTWAKLKGAITTHCDQEVQDPSSVLKLIKLAEISYATNCEETAAVPLLNGYNCYVIPEENKKHAMEDANGFSQLTNKVNRLSFAVHLLALTLLEITDQPTEGHSHTGQDGRWSAVLSEGDSIKAARPKVEEALRQSERSDEDSYNLLMALTDIGFDVSV